VKYGAIVYGCAFSPVWVGSIQMSMMKNKAIFANFLEKMLKIS